MEYFIPWDCFAAPELKAVGNRPSVKPVVETVVITSHVLVSVRVEQLIDGEIASNAEGLSAHQECHDCHQGHLSKFTPQRMNACLEACVRHVSCTVWTTHKGLSERTGMSHVMSGILPT